MRATRYKYLILLDLVSQIIFGEGCDTLYHCLPRHRPSKANTHITGPFSYGICMKPMSVLAVL
jgi:hypothetical protein